MVLADDAAWEPPLLLGVDEADARLRGVRTDIRLRGVRTGVLREVVGAGLVFNIAALSPGDEKSSLCACPAESPESRQ